MKKNFVVRYSSFAHSPEHAFESSEANVEVCARCGLYRGAHENTGFVPKQEPSVLGDDGAYRIERAWKVGE